MRCLLLVAALLLSLSAEAGKNKKIKTYPKVYTIEQVDGLISAKDYERAIWHIINLFGTDSVTAKAKMLSLKGLVPELDKEIYLIFSTTAIMDPQINSQAGNGGMTIDADKMKQKGRWGDALIRIIRE